jgi:ATPase subunit of ABC transporter with duplicated ATPase domains
MVSHRHPFRWAAVRILQISISVKVNQYSGNYTFWYSLPNGKTTPTGANKKQGGQEKKSYKSSSLDLVQTFAKSKAVKKMIEKLDILEIKPSSEDILRFFDRDRSW